MTLSTGGRSFGVSRRVTLSAKPIASERKARLDDPWACQTEGRVADLKRRIPILKRLIADCDRLAADLEQEVRNEENRVKIHDPAHSAYSIYARATASRRDNFRRSADELRAHLATAEQALLKAREVFAEATAYPADHSAASPRARAVAKGTLTLVGHHLSSVL